MTRAEEKTSMIDCENLVKIYKTSDLEVVALQGLDLTVTAGELMAIIGNSGSGKSTLLNMLGGLDRPSAGRLFVNGQDLLKLGERDIFEYKRRTVGFVWQNNARNLIPYLTAAENVELPMILISAKEKRRRAAELLDLVGLAHRKNNRLSQLSGGEQQRVAIAIALANTPKLLLADEPTGAVDSKTAAMILDLLRSLNRRLGITIVIVTHDMEISRKVDRVVSIRDGRTSSEFLSRSYRDELAGLEGRGFEASEPEEEDDTHEEFVVLDRVGRMQVPKDYMDRHSLKLNSRLRFAYDNDRIIFEPLIEKKATPEAAEAPADDNVTAETVQETISDSKDKE